MLYLNISRLLSERLFFFDTAKRIYFLFGNFCKVYADIIIVFITFPHMIGNYDDAV
jgi:hypothetical protein